jgi:dTDP-4-amino-4,6-dideoxygalactose transaminase
MSRIFLSAPHMDGDERQLLLDAFDSNWIAPVGPDIAAFEQEFARVVELPYATALSSGTAALHLALLALEVGPGDDVIVSDFTFAASANAVTYVGARPVFIDSDASTWNMDPDLLAGELAARAKRGKLPKAIVVVDLYGQCADYDRISPICAEYGVPVVEDAAEALGATYRGVPAGSFGTVGIFSFNGNKILTTGGGGMLASTDGSFVERIRYLSTQAREPVLHYEHTTIGFNYRMSNLLAAIGRGQLRRLADKVQRRRSIYTHYERALGPLPGIEFMPEADYGTANRWLTCLLVDPDAFGASRDDIIGALEEQDIESRPTWKPMHLQPVFAEAPYRGNEVATGLFERGLCLPSGTSNEDSDIDRVVEAVLAVHRSTGGHSVDVATGRVG